MVTPVLVICEELAQSLTQDTLRFLQPKVLGSLNYLSCEDRMIATICFSSCIKAEGLGNGSSTLTCIACMRYWVLFPLLNKKVKQDKYAGWVFVNLIQDKVIWDLIFK